MKNAKLQDANIVVYICYKALVTERESVVRYRDQLSCWHCLQSKYSRKVRQEDRRFEGSLG